ncbi:MAG: flagellar biosynthetic protein FliR [Desulfobulbia bacterium]
MVLTFDFLPQTAFAFLLIFARVGAITMSLPGIGDRTVPPRIRLVFALALTLVLYPLLHNSGVQIPQSLMGMVLALAREVILGIILGISVRLIISAVQIAGSVIAMQTGLGFAQSIDPSQGVQTSLFAGFLSVLSITVIFATDLHHLLLGAIHDSYQLFPIGHSFVLADFTEMAIKTLSSAFRIALQLSAPFLVFGLIFYLGVGILSRLIPQVQVFFIAMPANILMGFIIFMLLLSTLILWYLDYFGTAMTPFLV